jgi:hypothetical protein
MRKVHCGSRLRDPADVLTQQNQARTEGVVPVTSIQVWGVPSEPTRKDLLSSSRDAVTPVTYLESYLDIFTWRIIAKS